MTGQIRRTMHHRQPFPYLHAVVLTALLFLSFSHAWATNETPVVDGPKRAFGYMIGDVLLQRVKLNATDRTVTDIEPLPLGRIGRWLERQSVTQITDSFGDTWLEVKYQIINSPTTVLNDELPALTLVGHAEHTIEVAAFPFSLGPITTERNSKVSTIQAIRPDRQPMIRDTRKANRLFIEFGLALLATLLAWLAWWYRRQQKERTRLPFAFAWHRVERAQLSHEDETPEAWIALHDALNRYGGKTIQSASVVELIQAYPWMKPLHSRLEAFYKSSSARFFEHPARHDEFDIRSLIFDLYQVEKRQAN